jgi:hypothetical protein
MATVRRRYDAPVGVDRAWGLWTDLARWPSFVEGFKHVERVQGEWPLEGARVTWRSTPGGRGVVTEKVLRSEPPGLLVTQVFEEALTGTHTARLAPVGELGETWIELELDYQLTRAGVMRQLTDVLFIRRELGAAMQRTLRRFATEALEESAL